MLKLSFTGATMLSLGYKYLKTLPRYADTVLV
jgi:hypothetical protein